MRRSSDLSPEIAEESNWWRDAVFYQVFPDRFANGDPANDPSVASTSASASGAAPLMDYLLADEGASR